MGLCLDVRKEIYRIIRRNKDLLTIRCLTGTCKQIYKDIKKIGGGQMTCNKKLAKAIGKCGSLTMVEWFDGIIKFNLVLTSAISNGNYFLVSCFNINNRKEVQKGNYISTDDIFSALRRRFDIDMIYIVAKIEKGDKTIFTYNRMVQLAQIAISLKREDFFQSIDKCKYDRLKYSEYALRNKLKNPYNSRRYGRCAKKYLKQQKCLL